MKSLTEVLLPSAAEMDEWFRMGVEDRRHPTPEGRARRRQAGWSWAQHRHARGFADLDSALLTPPNGNIKLLKSVIPTYGLTLQHYVKRVNTHLVVNGCPHAGDCVKVCVLNNGHGNRSSVIEARKAKTSWLVENPRGFSYLLGYELAGVEKKWGKALFRPNVNSDVRWELLLPSLTSGRVLPGITSYGYTKDPFILDTDGWADEAYRVAYSWNENSDLDPVIAFIDRGGSVAVVTSRRKGAPVGEHQGLLGYNNAHRVRDADKTDEWMFERGTVGDLSAKGKARSLIGKSGFVVTV